MIFFMLDCLTFTSVIILTIKMYFPVLPIFLPKTDKSVASFDRGKSL